MIKPAHGILVAALLLGCGHAPAPPPTVPLPPAPPAPVAAPEGDVPFTGTYTKYAKLTYNEGRRIRVVNTDGEATLRIVPGQATYDQTFISRGEPQRVVQVYKFRTSDVRSVGEDAYEISMAFQRIEGETPSYSPDSKDVKLVARRRASGWEIGLATTDTRGRRGGVAFAIEPPDPPDPSLLHGVIGYPPPPPDVAAMPPDAAITPSGLGTKVLSPGTGTAHPGPRDTVRVHYTGWTRDGTMFDSSVVRGEPVSLRLEQVIKGWTEGVQLMVAGERRRLWIPADLAYGNDPKNGAPAGDLVFDVELLDFTAAPPAPPVPADVKAPPANAKKTRSGLAYRVLKKGNGKRSPKATDTVVVHYSGWTTDGKMFDSSVTRGAPATFRLEHVIKGWTEGVQLMKAGDVVRFWMPASLAYGDSPRAGVPAGMLVFDIELISIQ